VSDRPILFHFPTDHINLATAADNAKDFPKALHLYMKAFECLSAYLKCEKNEEAKEMLKNKARTKPPLLAA
jgi:elongation factor P--beta-lysine ligase